MQAWVDAVNETIRIKYGISIVTFLSPITQGLVMKIFGISADVNDGVQIINGIKLPDPPCAGKPWVCGVTDVVEHDSRVFVTIYLYHKP
jgi:hypothetical protein